MNKIFSARLPVDPPDGIKKGLQAKKQPPDYLSFFFELSGQKITFVPPEELE